MSAYDFAWLSKHPAWARRLEMLKSLSKGQLPPATAHQLGRLKRLKREADEASATYQQYERKLGLDKASCPHPPEMIKLEQYGRKDDYGSYIRGSTGSFSCARCSLSLFHFIDDGEGKIEKRF